MEQLKADSKIFDFSVPGPMFEGLPETYYVRFRGFGLWSPNGSGSVLVREGHEVVIRLGASYPRMMPELIWKTPIFHPNISANGIVCLGGYSTHWVPSLQLDELCVMLWDMIRYANFDVDSPYNREAARWAREQTAYELPVDRRPLRSISRCQPADSAPASTDAESLPWLTSADALPSEPRQPASVPMAEVVFVEEDVVEAEIIASEMSPRESAEILFID
jgi:hypothetical protein